VRTDFHENSVGQFSGYTTTLSQEGSNDVVMTTGNCEYLQNMSSDITQMVIVLSNWGSDSLNWLQHGVCEGSCSRTDTLTQFSNLSFTSAAANPNPPEPTPPEPEDEDVEYKYGSECTRANQDTSRCTNNCDCHISWPFDDPLKWRSPQAGCRCLPR